MSLKFNKIIHDSRNWQALKATMAVLPKKEKGDVFELFTKYFLKSHPYYRSTLQHVWLFKDLTPKLKQELGLPTGDQGIDLVAKTKSNQYWAIQCKYLENEDQRLSHKFISTFGNLAFAISKKFSFGLVCTTAERFSKAYSVQDSISFCTSEVWRNLTQEEFDNIRALALNEPVLLKPYNPFPHQDRAIQNALKHFIQNDASRGKLILPCGSGKSLAGFWIADRLRAKSILVALPSLALVRQTLSTWLREAVALKIDVEWICVCSDESIGKEDDVAIHVQDLGIPCLTDEAFISRWLAHKSGKIKVVFSTYQSGITIINASKSADFKFDLGILDEAHKTVGQKGKLFSHLLYDENISISKRLFMTATERRYRGSSDDIASMDDIDLYGDTFELLTFKEALEVNPPILSDYRIITVIVDQAEIKELIEKNAYVKPTKGRWDDKVEAHTLTAIIALRKAMQRFPIRHAVSFHTSIARAKAFEESQEKITELITDFDPIDTFHVTGASPTSERSKTIEAFTNSPKALITNARCLTEGVDIPNIDCILFADPKKSTIDIVQAVGRALRISKGKQYGYVIIPILIDEKDGEQVVDDEAYSDLLLTLRALASNDDRIIEYFKLRSEKGLSKSRNSSSDDLLEIYGQRIDLENLVGELELRVWSRLGKLSWRPFDEARDFVQSLCLENQFEWSQYCKSGSKPADIPVSPERVYKDKGWNGMGDWLGTGTIASQQKKFRPFEKAREFVHSLGFANETEWRQYCRSGEKPQDIPADPRGTYENKGWSGFGDWLGTGAVANQFKDYRTFDDARSFVHSLGLKSSAEWRQYCRSGEKPEDIPANPKTVYNKIGWSGMGDWLGTGTIASYLKEFRQFELARAFVQSLGFRTEDDWLQYCKSGEKPEDIPVSPRHNYRNKGWQGMGDWLGTETIANQFKDFRSFDSARRFARSLGLRKSSEWWQYCISGKKPEDIPADPRNKYLEKGWKGWGDWLGTAAIASFLKEYRSFEEARVFIHSLGLKNQTEWSQYCKSGEKPEDIPADPRRTYKDQGWNGMGDWLGSGTISNRLKEYLPFKEARAFVHSLGLKNQDEWRQYCKSGEKPEYIPAEPRNKYLNKGWRGFTDWLGKER